MAKVSSNAYVQVPLGKYDTKATFASLSSMSVLQVSRTICSKMCASEILSKADYMWSQYVFGSCGVNSSFVNRSCEVAFVRTSVRF
jgi:hypothetical protein